jgi:tetratricopeptide (TPR) repeat protein
MKSPLPPQHPPRGQNGAAEYTAAFDLCDRALHIDNGNVFALTGMTLKYIFPVVEAQSRDPQADIRRADELVSRALAIDPNYYFAHFAKAYVLMAQGRTQEAVIEGERSLALNPSFIDAYNALCVANNSLGGRIVPWSLPTRRLASVRATRSCANYITRRDGPSS